VQHVRADLLLCCAMTGPPTGTADTEAAALVKEKDNVAATER
jgi:hypothetical protein